MPRCIAGRYRLPCLHYPIINQKFPMIKHVFALCLFGLVLVGCQSNSETETGDDAPVMQDPQPATPEQVEERTSNLPNPTDIRFSWAEPKMDENDVPTTELYARFDRNRIPLGTVNAPSQLDQAEWGTYNVPDEALTAAYSFYAGLLEVFYMVRTNQTIEIYRAEQDEMDNEVLSYELIKMYPVAPMD